MVFDLAGLIKALVDEEIDFVVIGGIAVAAHSVVRATEDVDLVPDPETANLDRLLDVLVRLNAHLTLDPTRGIDDGVRDSVARGRNLTVTTSLGDVDVVQALPGVPPYDELLADALAVELHDTTFRVCSRAHLIAMKQARASPLDQADLERLTGDRRGPIPDEPAD